MTGLWLVLAVAVIGAMAGLAYWEFVIAEGAYLGPRVVAWTYDLVAHRYDAIKQFNPGEESRFVTGPLLRQLDNVQCPLVLDVATGTGRLPLALFRAHFTGLIVGLDLSRKMLHQAHCKLRPYGDKVCLIWQDARYLPFQDGVFDAVACLESLEFLPEPVQSLVEMVRVLAPGGVLFVTNRVGPEARLLPGRAFPRPLFRQVLAAQPLRDVEIWPWQVNYDLALARKEGHVGATRKGKVAMASALWDPSVVDG